jgi:hypothetical protein
MRLFFSLLSFLPLVVAGQPKLSWQNVDSLYGPLPQSVHVYFTNQAMDTAPFKAFYVIADLKDKALHFTTDTTLNRRITPSRFYEKNDHPLLVVNGTFFSFETNRNLNLVVKEGKTIALNQQTMKGRGKDTLTYSHPFFATIGLSKNREPDIAWTVTDSNSKSVYASQFPLQAVKDSVDQHKLDYFLSATNKEAHASSAPSFRKWKMETAIGGGPVLVQNGEIKITNNEELKFAGKAINDKHPRTAIGYTKDKKLIILVIEGRNKQAAGATLVQEAQLLKDLGCVEALNLDGGGSSCLLVNGKETIKPSDPAGQRAIPAVFLIRQKE